MTMHGKVLSLVPLAWLGFGLVTFGSPDRADGSPHHQTRPALEVTYIANEGFLASAGASKALIDANQLRMKPVDRRRMNRSLLEDAYPDVIAEHQWETPRRKLSHRLSLWGNANFALLIAALCARDIPVTAAPSRMTF